MKMHHVGIACQDIEKTLKDFQGILNHQPISRVLYDPLQAVFVCLLKDADGNTIELVSGPTVAAFAQNGPQIYHICYEVDDIHLAISESTQKGAVLISEPKPAKLFDGRAVAFLQTEVGLIEFLESSPILENKKKDTTHTYDITITATFTADPILSPMHKLIQELNFNADCHLAPYNQISQYLLGVGEGSVAYNQNLHVLMIRIEDWVRYKESAHISAHFSFLIDAIQEFSSQLTYFLSVINSPVLVVLCPSYLTEKQDLTIYPSLSSHFKSALSKLRDQHSKFNVLYLDGEGAQTIEKHFFDQHANALGHIPYTKRGFSMLALQLMRKVYGLTRPPLKLIAVDADNVLWRGICGEQAVEDITLTPRELLIQQTLLEQYQRGILLCLVSKNNEEDVAAVFSHKKDMILKDEHFILKKISWGRKSDALRAISKELAIGLDAMIFLDDNPVECGEVLLHTPDVITLNLPMDEKETENRLRCFWPFDTLSTTHEDTHRHQYYKENLRRKELQEKLPNWEAFIESLDIKLTIFVPTKEDAERISQLTYRVNQFNFSAKKFSVSEVLNVLESPTEEILAIHVSDKFGDYGLVGVVKFAVDHVRCFGITDFFLRCRVLGKGVEHKIVWQLAQIAEEKQCEFISISFKKASKNVPAEKFLTQLPIVSTETHNDETIYKLRVDQTKDINCTLNLQNEEASENAPYTQQAIVHPIFSPLGLTKIAERWHNSKQFVTDLDQDDNREEDSPTYNSDFAVEHIQESLIALWGRELKVSLLNSTSDFFKLNGESLAAIQLMTKIFSVFNVNFSLNDFFQHSSIESLSHYIFSLQQEKKSKPSFLMAHQDRELPQPLSYAQRRLWFLEQLNQHSSVYNTFIALELIGDLEVESLEVAFSEIIKRHETLRTGYIKQYDEPRQIIHPIDKVSFQIATQDISHLDDDAIFTLVHKEAQTPFNITKPPLMRVTLLKRQPNDHILLINMHHLTNDTWSFNIFIRELNQLYSSKIDHTNINLSPLATQYVDYAVWHNGWVEQSSHVLSQIDYWKNKLESQSHFYFWGDYVASNEEIKKGGRIKFNLPDQLVIQFNQFAQRHQATFFSALFSIFSLLIGRCSNQEEVLISTVSSGRHYPGLDNIMGFFPNLLMLKINFEDNPDFINLLARSRSAILEALANQDVPFEKVIEALKIQRHSANLPMTNVMFAFEPDSIEEFSLSGLKIKRVYADNDAFLLSDYDSAKFDFMMYVQSDGTHLNGVIEFDKQLYKNEAVNNFINLFEVAIESALQQPEKSVLSLSLLKKSEMTLDQYYAAQLDSTKIHENHLIECLDRQIKEHKNEPALIYQNEIVTYAELGIVSKKFASYLIAKKVLPGDYVANYCDNKIDFIVSSIAVLRLGAIVVPLSSDYPTERNLSILNHLSIRHLIATQNAVDLRQENTNLINISVFKETVENIKPHETQAFNQEAYVLFTSGSTGLPKGVMLHGNAITNVACNSGFIQLTSHDHMGQIANIAFDASLFEIWGALLNGIPLVLLDKDIVLSAKEFRHSIEHHKVTTLFLTTALFNQIAMSDSEVFGQLNTLIVGGESENTDLIRNVLQSSHCPKHFLHAYGPTECTIFTTLYPIHHVEDHIRSIPIGKPLNQVDIFIFDRELNLAPVGVPGELYIGGIGVAREYVNNPELNNKKFIFNPLYESGKKTLFKTGDIVKQLPDGNIQFIGRDDDLIKIRGFRAELHEIEEAILEYSNIKQVTVLLKSNESLGKHLIAFVTLKKIQNFDTQDIKQFLKKKIHASFIPAFFIILDQLPLNYNGKIDKRILRLSEIKEEQYLQSIYVAPKTKIEKKLVAIFSAVLDIDQSKISVHDNFFDLGGHSLLVIKVLTAIQVEMGIELKISAFFQASTAYDLGQLIWLCEERKKLINDKECWLNSHLTASSLVALQNYGNKKPLFLIHPVGGTVFCYLGLSKYLGSDQPCYAIQDPSIESGMIMYSSVEEMAAQYIHFIQQIQPHGPYYLGGHSFGGMVAAEMAYQLLEAGEGIAFLGMLDTWLLSTSQPEIRERLKEKMVYHHEMTKQKITQENVDNRDALIELNFHRLQNLGFNYEPKVLECKITLFKAKDNMKDFAEIDDWANHWESFTTYPIEVIPVSGDHETMLKEPYVIALAATLKHFLNQVSSKGKIEYTEAVASF